MRDAKGISLVCAGTVFLLSVSGCGYDLKVKVESNTQWSGAFGNRTVDGSGSATVDVPDDRPQCAVVQKEHEDGYLTARMICEKKGLSALFGSEDEEDAATTTAEYGVVSICSKAD